MKHCNAELFPNNSFVLLKKTNFEFILCKLFIISYKYVHGNLFILQIFTVNFINVQKNVIHLQFFLSALHTLISIFLHFSKIFKSSPFSIHFTAFSTFLRTFQSIFAVSRLLLLKTISSTSFRLLSIVNRAHFHRNKSSPTRFLCCFI